MTMTGDTVHDTKEQAFDGAYTKIYTAIYGGAPGQADIDIAHRYGTVNEAINAKTASAPPPTLAQKGITPEMITASTSGDMEKPLGENNSYTPEQQSRADFNRVVAGVNDSIDRGQHPEKYISASETAANAANVKGIFNTLLGRDPTANEIAHFAPELAGSPQNAYLIEQAIQQSPEYVQAVNTKQQAAYTQQAQSASSALNDQLMQTQQTAFNNALPEILSSFQRAGRIGSSGVANAIAKQQAVLDQQRQQTLANLNYQTTVQGLGYNQQNFVNGQNQAFQNYLQQQGPQLAQQYNLQNAQNFNNFQAPFNQLQRQYSLADQNTQRQNQLQDYSMQRQDYQNDFNRYISSQNQNAMYGLFGSVLGAGIKGLGAYAGGGF